MEHRTKRIRQERQDSVSGAVPAVREEVLRRLPRRSVGFFVRKASAARRTEETDTTCACSLWPPLALERRDFMRFTAACLQPLSVDGQLIVGEFPD